MLIDIKLFGQYSIFVHQHFEKIFCVGIFSNQNDYRLPFKKSIKLENNNKAKNDE